MEDIVKYRITATMRPETYCITQDTIVVRKDGSMVVIPAGTLLTAPVPDAPIKVEIVSPPKGEERE